MCHHNSALIRIFTAALGERLIATAGFAEAQRESQVPVQEEAYPPEEDIQPSAAGGEQVPEASGPAFLGTLNAEQLAAMDLIPSGSRESQRGAPSTEALL